VALIFPYPAPLGLGVGLVWLVLGLGLELGLVLWFGLGKMSGKEMSRGDVRQSLYTFAFRSCLLYTLPLDVRLCG